ncbi:hypothetical protein MAE02_57140 [Microvirga aerophila]|uniref:DUF6894 domain-containing protein n=1 Tax=Microvirga aerophila TaxID=670291 RepID=A0A512C1C8_9HYPH|nr:hypothetical protein MAE02_57140 [Microvirga aerophila]
MLELLRHKGLISAVYWVALGDTMPRFYLHIRCKDGGMSYDQSGLDYPDVETACHAVVLGARDLKQVFTARGHDPQDYAVEVENDTGKVVFRLPFSQDLTPSHATYRIVGSNLGWLIYCNDEFVGGFAQQSSAEFLVWEMVETRCAEQKASEVLIEDEFGCEKHLCPCFKEAPPGTLLS